MAGYTGVCVCVHVCAGAAPTWLANTLFEAQHSPGGAVAECRLLLILAELAVV